MSTTYCCECRDGRTITGKPKWELSDLKKMNALQLARVLTELSEFARYYETNFFYPASRLEKEIRRVEDFYDQSKLFLIVSGIAAGVFTFFWITLALLPIFRFSGLTVTMAVMTFLSILIFIPVLFRFISAQEDYSKRLPRYQAKQKQLEQKLEKEIYGSYLEFLIGGYIVSPEYSLCGDALDHIAKSLTMHTAATMSEATQLCKQKFPHSPVPRIILSLRSTADGTEPVKIKQEPAPKAVMASLSKLDNVQESDIDSLVQLADYLNAAIKNYALTQNVSSETGHSTMNLEEEALIREFRTLTPDEKKRIRRVVHSFYTKQY